VEAEAVGATVAVEDQITQIEPLSPILKVVTIMVMAEQMAQTTLLLYNVKFV
jgi:hypothetical protein